MKNAFAAALGLVVLGSLSATNAHAGCGVPSDVAFQGGAGFEFGAGRFVSDSRSDDDAIVGMWRVTFTAEGNGPGLPPDGAVIDAVFAQWHGDGTEIMNSSRNPATQSFCLGMWKRVGSRHYKLNHFAISWDPSVSQDAPQGPANIREDVTLSSGGRTFTGTFTIDQYDQAGNLLVHLVGVLKGTRITVDTPASSLF